MFKNIMIPVDGSPLADRAFPLSVDIAKSCGATLHIVRVHVTVAPGVEGAITTNYDQLLREWEADTLTSHIARAGAHGVHAIGELLGGPVVEGLQRYAEANRIDLIVMSTHGRDGITRVLLGSVAEQLTRDTGTPVLLLNGRSNTEGVSRMLIPLDASTEAAAVLPHALNMLHMGVREVILLHVVSSAPPPWTEEREYPWLQEVRAMFPADMKVRQIVMGGYRPSEAILRCATAESVDLIAMATHGRSGWTRLTHGSVAEQVLRQADCAVLLKNVSGALQEPDGVLGHIQATAAM